MSKIIGIDLGTTNSPLPISREEMYVNAYDKQPRMAAGQVQCFVRFTYDINGVPEHIPIYFKILCQYSSNTAAPELNISCFVPGTRISSAFPGFC